MSRVEKCPLCGGELEGGFLFTGSGIRWADDERWASRLPGHRGENILSSFTWKQPPRIEAWRCTKCRLVIFDY